MKKFLSLVLALVMTVSLVTIGASAKTYTDASKINYAEAVDVVSACKIIDGYTDGSFNPTGTLTRGAAAKIICNMILGPTTAGALGADTKPFSDVATNNVFAGYIAYCSSQGIINGYADGTFKPAGTLTGHAFLKMLLGALGYDAAIEKFTGANWSVNVAKLATNLKLTDGNDSFVGSKAITREEACLYAFNTLKTSVVDYESKGTQITINGAVIATGASKAAVQKWTGTEGTNYETNHSASAAGETKEFCEVYFSKLAKNNAKTADDFKRPAHQWFYGAVCNDDTSIGVYKDTPVVTYTAAVNGGTLYADLGKVTVASLTSYENGYTTSNADAIKACIVADNENSFGGNGTVIEVYKTSSTAENYTIVAVQTFVGTITGHTDAVKYTDGTIKTKENVTVTAYDSANPTVPVTGLTFNTTDFTDKDATDGTVVIGTASTADGSTYTIQSLKAATSKTVVPTTLNASSFVADGVTYKYDENHDGSIVSGDVTGKVSKVIYFDDYGYVIKVANPGTTTNYAVVLNATTSSTLDGATYNVRLLMGDGTTDDAVATTAATTSYTSANATTGEYKIGSIVTYTKNSAGKYVLTAKADSAAKTAAITKNVVTFTAGGDTNNKANSKTLFLVKTVKDDVASYAVYTGIANVPSITSATNTAVYASGTYADVVYVDTAVLATASSTSKDVIYLSSVGMTTSTDVTKGTYYTYNAVVNGTITTIEASASNIASGIYTSMTKNDKGVVTSMAAMSTTASDSVHAASGTGTAVAANGIVKIQSAELSYNDATVVYKVASDGTITKSSVSAIKADLNDTVVYYTTDNMLTAAYITVVA